MSFKISTLPAASPFGPPAMAFLQMAGDGKQAWRSKLKSPMAMTGCSCAAAKFRNPIACRSRTLAFRGPGD